MPDHRFTFPSVGPLGLGSPPSRPSTSSHRYYDPLRLPLLHPGSLRFPLDSRYLAFTRFGSCFPQDSLSGWNKPGQCPASFVYRFACPGFHSARRWRFSRVPRLPLYLHALLGDPGGVLSTCHNVLRTDAFRLSQAVSFPRFTPGYPCGPQL